MAHFHLFESASKGGELKFMLGTQSSATWDRGSSDYPNLFYSFELKRVTVILSCLNPDIHEEEFTVLGEGPINNYKFQLTHKCVCWNACKCKFLSTVI
jgi:hypothetical protein